MKDTLCHQLSSTGLRQEDVHNIISDVESWARASGPEWTVQRLKDLKNEAVTRMGGNPVPAPWVSRTRGGNVSGSWGKLVTPGVRPKTIQRRLACLMIYTDFKHGTSVPTRKQMDKFLPAVHSLTVTVSHGVNRIGQVDSQPLRYLHRKFMVDPVSELRLSPSRRAPIIGEDTAPVRAENPVWELGFVDRRRLVRPTRSVSEIDVARWFPNHRYSSAVTELANADPEFKLWLAKLDHLRTQGRDVLPLIAAERNLSGSVPTNVVICDQASWEKFTATDVGVVSFIQEPGYKLRSVANPNRLLQAWMRPLQLALFEHLSSLPQDCTFDQDKGMRVVQGWLRDGARVHSVDLSSATDRFPLSYQLSLLRDAGGHDSRFARDLDIFHAISRARWRTPTLEQELGIQSVSWTNGQPLGLGPSFAAFALAHHNVVREFTDDYVILGDDIVIKGDLAAAAYRDRILGMGCEISESKSMSSDKVAEFAGRVITPERVYSQPKWKEPSDRSFLDFVRNMGPSGLFSLRPRQRSVAQALLAVPEEFGGLGLNPEGISLAERLERYSAFADLPSPGEPQESAIGRRIALQLALQEPFWAPTDKVAKGPADQAVLPLSSSVKEQVVLYHRPRRISDPDLVGLPGYVLGVSTSDPRGRTALEIWEDKLRNLYQLGLEKPANHRRDLYKSRAGQVSRRVQSALQTNVSHPPTGPVPTHGNEL